jgi:hypothetical protein
VLAGGCATCVARALARPRVAVITGNAEPPAKMHARIIASGIDGSVMLAVHV